MAGTEPLFPPLTSREEVHRRLRVIFPEGTPARGYCTRDIAAATVYTLLYIGAIEGTGRFASPQHVYRMTDIQAADLTTEERLRYGTTFQASGEHWYADTSREPIRDETLREGFIQLGAATAREDLAPTSPKPRYALTRTFAALFDPSVTGDRLASAISDWQGATLSPSALARTRLLAGGVVASAEGVLVTFPNGETRRMAAGPSSLISKAVIEQFVPRFLGSPGVLWLSDSRTKVHYRDERLAEAIGLSINADRDLPDIILVDLLPADPLLVFVEVVATDGPITPRRKEALLSVAATAAFREDQVVFLTAYRDRGGTPTKKTFAELAWRSFVWFASEPHQLIVLRDAPPIGAPLVSLL